MNILLKINWLRLNISYIWHRWSFKDANVHGLLRIVIDESKAHSGLLDILKSIVGCYYISKLNGIDFRIEFTHPFILKDYLLPNQIQWDIDDCSKFTKSSRMLNYYGVGNLPVLQKVCNYHVYNFRGYNILQRNQIQDWEILWTNLYHELFVPSPMLQAQLETLPFEENTYCAVHVRFVNSIEVLEPGYKQSVILKPDEQKQLIDKCIMKIQEISRLTELNIVVFSDSNRFLDMAKDNGFCILPGVVGHISYHHENDIVMKTFVDLYAIGQAQKVYSIVGEHLYNSVFPLYAALIKGKQFSRVVY